jgi:hypothetical protein
VRFGMSSAAEAEAAIAYFNAFHDGFVADLRLTSHNSFPGRGVQKVGRSLDLELGFAHYNYERDTRPADQRIRASFRGVMYVAAEVTDLGTESSVTYAEVTQATRSRDDGSEEACLLASVIRAPPRGVTLRCGAGVGSRGTDRVHVQLDSVRGAVAPPGERHPPAWLPTMRATGALDALA